MALQIKLIITVQKSKEDNKVGQNGMEHEAVKVGRFSICLQFACTKGPEMVGDWVILNQQLEIGWWTISMHGQMWKNCIIVADRHSKVILLHSEHVLKFTLCQNFHMNVDLKCENMKQMKFQNCQPLKVEKAF